MRKEATRSREGGFPSQESGEITAHPLPCGPCLPGRLCSVWALHCGEVQKGSREDGDRTVAVALGQERRVRKSSAQTPLTQEEGRQEEFCDLCDLFFRLLVVFFFPTLASS